MQLDQVREEEKPLQYLLVHTPNVINAYLDKQLNKDKSEPSTDKGKETNALTEITCNPEDNHNHLGKNEELLGLVLQSKPEKKFERVKFTFLHRPSKSEVSSMFKNLIKKNICE